MKFCSLFLFYGLGVLSARAQYVNIPDNNFVTWLSTNGYAGCLSGNQLDTTCPGLLFTTELQITQLIYEINDLDGIQISTTSIHSSVSTSA